MPLHGLTSKQILTLTCLIFTYYPAPSNGRLRLVDNGYKGLVVAISNAMPEEQCSQIILGLKGTLQEFSKILLTFSEGRVWLRDVAIILPKDWREDAISCPPLKSIEHTAVVPEVHIKVASPHPTFGSLPWVHQTQGCRKQGDYIQMASEFVQASSANAYSHMAELLMEEWVKFRWGTFEESGFPDDPLYPGVFYDPRTGRNKPNTCTNRLTDHAPVCHAATYVPEAPTKQNAQCNGQSAWEIIQQSQDFREGRSRTSNASVYLSPAVTYVIVSPPQLVLVVEDTAAMNLQQRWEFMRKAVRHVMVYDVADEVYVGVVVFNSVAKTTAPLIKIDSYTDIRQRIGASLPRNPSTVAESQKCVICGFQEAIQVLRNSPAGYLGGKVILVTTGNGFISNDEVAEMEHLAVLRRLRIDTVFYPLTEHRTFITDASSLKSVVAVTGGSSFSVMDEGVGKDSKVGMMVALVNAFFSAMRYSSPESSQTESALVHSESYQGGITSLAEGSFTIDDSFGPSFRFSVFYYDLSHVGNTVQLRSPTGETIDAINMREDGDANVIFTSEKAEKGSWHYQVENRADSHQALHIQVTSTESSLRRVNLRVWSSSHTNVINMTDLNIPVILYAELKEGTSPIVGAKVTGRLQRLGTNVSGTSYSYINFDLLDNGNGDPDITGDDGVYTRYLPSIYGNTGYYKLTITADNNDGLARFPTKTDFAQSNLVNMNRQSPRCCGSAIKYRHLKPVAPFQRYFDYGVLDIMSLSSGADLLPPNRILDLRSEFNSTSFELNLRWTAPGDDYDNGRARRYEATIADSWKKANDFEGEIITSMPLPKYSGTEQDTSVEITRYKQMIYVSVRALDEAGNQGPVSNVISHWVPVAPTLPPAVIIPMTLQPSTNNAQPLGSEVSVPKKAKGVSIELIAIIIGSSVGSLLIAIALATSLYCHITRRQEHQERDDDKIIESRPNVNDDSTPSSELGKCQASAEAMPREEETHTDEQPLSPTPSCRVTNSMPMHPCQQMVMPTGPTMEVVEPQSCFQICPDPFPDIIHMSTSSCQIAQVSPSVRSDFTPHPSPYTNEMTFSYTNPTHFQYPNPSSPYSACVMANFFPDTPPAHSQTGSTQFTDLVYQADLTCPTQMTCLPVNSICSPVQSPLYGATQNVVASTSNQGNIFCNPASPSYGPCTSNPGEFHMGGNLRNPVSSLPYDPTCQSQPSCSNQGVTFCETVPPHSFGTNLTSASSSNQRIPVCGPNQSISFGPSLNEPLDSQCTTMYTRISPPAPFKPSLEENVTTVSSTVAYSDEKRTEVTHL